MKEYITIHNVGPLRHIEQLEILPLTVLIGESAIGKSTLMKVLVLMRYLYKRANIRSFLKHSKITNSPFRIRFESLLKTTNLVAFFQSNSYIRYEVHADSGNVYSIEYGNSKIKRTLLPEISEEDLTFWKESFVSENRNVIPSWSANALTNKNASLGFYFHQFERYIPEPELLPDDKPKFSKNELLEVLNQLNKTPEEIILDLMDHITN